MSAVLGMLQESEKFAEADKLKTQLIEEGNKGQSVVNETEKGMYLLHTHLPASNRWS